MTRQVLMAALLGALAAPALGQWTATVLHPSGAYSSSVQSLAPGQQAGTVQLSSLASTGNAALWSGTAGSWSSLGQGFATTYGTTGPQQVGQFNGRASLWSGTVTSRMELFNGVSIAYGIAGGQQVGFIWTGSENFAAMWSGTAGSLVNLHPQSAIRSEARATDGTHQWGGAVFVGPNGQYGRALRWNGSSASVIDFSPPGAQWAGVLGVGGGQQVGSATFPGTQAHAMIWNGTPESWEDLHPLPGSGSSYLYATTGTMQVGSSHVPGFSFPHAGVWSGPAASFIDLNQFLPSGYGGESLAASIIVDGGITYIGGYARGPSGQKEAVLWTLVPSPASGSVALGGLALLARRRRRKRELPFPPPRNRTPTQPRPQTRRSRYTPYPLGPTSIASPLSFTTASIRSGERSINPSHCRWL